MKIRIAYSLLCLTLLTFFTSFSPDENGSRIKTNEGKLFNIGGDVTLIQGVLHFKNESGKKSKVDYQDVEWMTLGDKVYVRYFVDSKNKKRDLLRLVAQTPKHRIWRMENFSGADFIYIFDYKDQLVDERIKLYSASDGAWKKNNREAIDKLKPYLKDCEGVVEKMESYHSQRNDIFDGLVYFDCNGPKPFTELLK